MTFDSQLLALGSTPPRTERLLSRHVSLSAGLKYFGISDVDADQLIIEANARGTSDVPLTVIRSTWLDEVRMEFVLRRMPGNHAHLFALCSAGAASKSEQNAS